MKKARQHLLEEHNKEQERDKDLMFKDFVIFILIFSISLLFFIPKVYLSNKIYYFSLEISDLNSKREVLLQENRAIKMELEKLKYQNQILNPLENLNLYN